MDTLQEVIEIFEARMELIKEVVSHLNKLDDSEIAKEQVDSALNLKGSDLLTLAQLSDEDLKIANSTFDELFTAESNDSASGMKNMATDLAKMLDK